MQAATFASSDPQGTGQQSSRATEDVQNQERKSHASTPFSTTIVKSAVERVYALYDGEVPPRNSQLAGDSDIAKARAS